MSGGRLSAPVYDEEKDCNLGFLMRILSEGDIVVLLTKTKEVLMAMPYCKPEVDLRNPENFRTLYVDIRSMPSLGSPGEWPEYFQGIGAVVCEDKATQEKICKRQMPNTYNMRI
jgi:hypothetical protein